MADSLFAKTAYHIETPEGRRVGTIANTSAADAMIALACHEDLAAVAKTYLAFLHRMKAENPELPIDEELASVGKAVARTDRTRWMPNRAGELCFLERNEPVWGKYVDKAAGDALGVVE